MSIRDQIRCIEFHVAGVSTARNQEYSQKSASGNLAIKRGVTHTTEVGRKKTDSFTRTVIDTLSFAGGRGPFTMKITLRGKVLLKEKLTPAALGKLLKDKASIDFLINQGLPYSCSTIAYLTETMGFSPIILAPRYNPV